VPADVERDSTSYPRQVRGGTAAEGALIAIGVESWRLSRLFKRALEKLDLNEANRFESQLRYFERKLEGHLSDAGIRLVTVEGDRFDPGMAATALNAADFSGDQDLIVDQMIEPIVMGKDGLLREGVVLLARKSR
jgi:hypothetical protein